MTTRNRSGDTLSLQYSHLAPSDNAGGAHSHRKNEFSLQDSTPSMKINNIHLAISLALAQFEWESENIFIDTSGTFIIAASSYQITRTEDTHCVSLRFRPANAWRGSGRGKTNGVPANWVQKRKINDDQMMSDSSLYTLINRLSSLDSLEAHYRD